MNYVINIWQVLVELSPWLFLGAGAAGILHVFFPADFVSRHLGKNGPGNVLRAVVFGIPMPLCSCGVIPAAVSLKKDGASDGASVGFLISTPQTGIDSIFVSASFLGWPFAVFKVVSAFITGLIGGAAVDMVTKNKGKVSEKVQNNSEAKTSLSDKFSELFKFMFEELLYGIWKWMVLGILISGAITTFIPNDVLANSPLTTGITGKLTVLIFSIGLYVCATGSVPIAGSLVAAGMPAGTALVFLMAGPATNIATIGTVLKVFGKKVLFIYLFVISAGSIILGQVFDYFYTSTAIKYTVAGNSHSYISIAFAVLFTVTIVYYAVSDTRLFFMEKFKKYHNGREKHTFVVQGMSCSSCAQKVKNGLLSVDGIGKVSINLESGTVNIEGQNINREDVLKSIRKKGYKVLS